MNLKSESFGFDPLKAQTLVIAPLAEPFLTSDRDVHTTSVIGYSRPNHSRIGTPFMNKYIWSRDYTLSTVWSDVGELNKLDTAVQKYSNSKRNTAPSRIEEGSLGSIFPKIVKESNLSERMNLANSVLVQTPKLVSFRHPSMQIESVGNLIDSIRLPMLPVCMGGS